MLRISLLGHLRMSYRGAEYAFAAHRRTLALLSYLLIHRSAPVRRDFLAFTIFPDVEESEARVQFRRNLHILQRNLPPSDHEPWILASSESVQWNPAAPSVIDMVEFEERLEADPAEGIELYSGDLLEGVYEEWISPERERLRVRYLAALTELMHAARRERRFAAALDYSGRILAADPLREDAMRASIATRYESGDRAGALAEYNEFALRLRSELGAEPMPETTVLRDAIARGAPIDVATAVEVRGAEALGASFNIPLAGRTDALEKLHAAWVRAARGHGGAVFVSGEAGIGKTRVVAELARRIESEGARILRGGTPALEDAPYQAVSEAIGSAGALLGTISVEPIWLRVVADICPQIMTFCGALPDAPAVATDRAQPRLIDGVARLFGALAEVRPTLVVLEDFHSAGIASAEMLRVLVHRATAQRVLYLVTFREEEVPRTHHLRKVRQELSGTSAASSLSLQRLAPEEIASIVRSIVPETVDRPEVAERIHRQSEGHPLFATQLAVDYVERQGIRSDTPPGTLDDVIVARLERLSEPARRCADVAAVVGPEFDIELVGGVLGWVEAEIVGALDELLERQLVREASNRARFSYVFSHQLVRVAAYARIDAERRRRYHLLVGRAMEALDAAPEENLAVELAGHWEGGHSFARAAACWLQAAERALLAHAPDEAADFAGRGIALEPQRDLRVALLRARETANNRRGKRVEQQRDGDELLALTSEEDIESRCDALGRRIALCAAINDLNGQMATIEQLLAYAREHAAQRWAGYAARAEANLYVVLRRPAQAEEAAREALTLSAGDPAEEILSRVAAARAMTSANRFDAALAELDLAFRQAKALDDPLVELSVLDARAFVYDARQDFAASRNVSLEILAIARRCGDRLGEARALLKLTVASFRLYDVDAAVEYNDAALELCRSIGDASGVHSLEQNAAAFETSLGRAEDGLQRLRALRDAAEQRSDREQLYYTTSNVGVALHQLGRYEQALVEETKALDLARAIGNKRLVALVLGDVGLTLSCIGRHDAAIAALSEAVETLQNLGVRMSVVNYQARLALALARRGQFPEGLELAREVATVYSTEPERFEEPPETLWYVAQALREGGAQDEAEAIVATAAAILNHRLERMGSQYRTAYAAIPWHEELTNAFERAQWASL